MASLSFEHGFICATASLLEHGITFIVIPAKAGIQSLYNLDTDFHRYDDSLRATATASLSFEHVFVCPTAMLALAT